MPRLGQIRTGALEDLADQQRFTPKATLLRHIRRARDLAQSIDPDKTYAQDWVVRRITGYQPALDDPARLVGEALLADLSSLVERLCSQAHLSLSDLDEPVLGVEAVSRRWSVSRRTVERYRRRGLVGLRAVDAQGQPRLVFPVVCVERFERAHTGLIADAARFSQMDDELRDQMIARARRYHDSLGLTLSTTAGRLARRFERSHEAVRQLLLRHEHSSSTPIFVDAPGTLDARRRRLLWRAWRRGATAAELAHRASRSPASIRRILGEQRALMLRRLDLRPVASPATSEGDLPAAVLEHPLAHTQLNRAVLTDARAFVEAAQDDPPVDPDAERVRGLAHATLLARAHQRVLALARFNPSPLALDEIETLLRWAALLRIALVRSQRALVVRSIEERLGAPLLTRPPEQIVQLHRDAIKGVVSAVSRFDPLHGGRLAAPVALALGRALAGVEPAGRERRASVQSATLEDWSRQVAPWQGRLDPPPLLIARLDALPPERAEVLRARYGLSGSRPLTLAQVREQCGVPPVRLERWIRQALASG